LPLAKPSVTRATTGRTGSPTKTSPLPLTGTPPGTPRHLKGAGAGGGNSDFRRLPSAPILPSRSPPTTSAPVNSGNSPVPRIKLWRKVVTEGQHGYSSPRLPSPPSQKSVSQAQLFSAGEHWNTGPPQTAVDRPGMGGSESVAAPLMRHMSSWAPPKLGTGYMPSNLAGATASARDISQHSLSQQHLSPRSKLPADIPSWISPRVVGPTGTVGPPVRPGDLSPLAPSASTTLGGPVTTLSGPSTLAAHAAATLGAQVASTTTPLAAAAGPADLGMSPRTSLPLTAGQLSPNRPAPAPQMRLVRSERYLSPGGSRTTREVLHWSADA